MSINTSEGWNAAALRLNTKAFISANGSPPVNNKELDAWVRNPDKSGVANVKKPN